MEGTEHGNGYFAPPAFLFDTRLPFGFFLFVSPEPESKFKLISWVNIFAQLCTFERQGGLFETDLNFSLSFPPQPSRPHFHLSSAQLSLSLLSHILNRSMASLNCLIALSRDTVGLCAYVSEKGRTFERHMVSHIYAHRHPLKLPPSCSSF
jgi:hypothetical protein